MKWAKLKTDPDLSEMTAKELNCFKVYDVLRKAKGPIPQFEGIINDAKGTVRDVFNRWNPKIYNYPKTDFGPKAKEKYETFCGGWLAFYDEVVRNKQTKHILHFEWDRKKHEVTIWISPPAVERKGMKYQDFIKYLPMAVDPPSTPAPPPPPRDL
jgi:hypothetical protein